MCGRYSLESKYSGRHYKVTDPHSHPYPPRYNIAPTQTAPTVIRTPEGRRFVPLRWGLVPSWATDPKVGNRMINARAETVAEKPAYRGPFRHQRCLVPATGFFEWKAEGKVKTPFHFILKSGEPFAFAGLYEWRQRPGEEALGTFTVITTTANELVRPVHERMPVILPPESYEAWLDPGIDDPARLKALLLPFDPGQMNAYAVSRAVNSPANDLPICIEPCELNSL